MSGILIFSVCSFINVMLNTVKTIVMYSKNKLSSSLINALTYGFYTVIVVLMAGEMPLMTKIFLTAITNFFGVWVSMSILQKFEKDKLWKVEVTFKAVHTEDVKEFLESVNIPYNYTVDETGRYAIFNIYCATQKESTSVKILVQKFRAKYFVSESKTL